MLNLQEYFLLVSNQMTPYVQKTILDSNFENNIQNTRLHVLHVY